MSLPFGGGVDQTVRVHGKESYQAPFINDAGLYVLTQRVMQDCPNYRPPTRLALDRRHPNVRGYYLVKETEAKPVVPGASVLQWDRIYAQIPKTREEGGIYSFDRPGFDGTESVAGRVNITAVTLTGLTSSGLGFARWDLTTANAHGLEVGDTVRIVQPGGFTYTDPSGVRRRSAGWTLNYRVIAKASATQFSVPRQHGLIISVKSAPDVPYIQVFARSRGPRRKLVAARVRYEYFLPGVTEGVDRFEDIAALQAFEIYDTDDGSTATTLSTTTEPTLSDYKDMVSNNELLVAEDSRVDYWMGNIIERRTIFVQAQ